MDSSHAAQCDADIREAVVVPSVLGEECLFMIQSFFREARERKKIERLGDSSEPSI